MKLTRHHKRISEGSLLERAFILEAEAKRLPQWMQLELEEVGLKWVDYPYNPGQVSPRMETTSSDVADAVDAFLQQHQDVICAVDKLQILQQGWESPDVGRYHLTKGLLNENETIKDIANKALDGEWLCMKYKTTGTGGAYGFIVRKALVIEAPDTIKGLLIGKKGANIKVLEQQAGHKIKIK